MQTQNLEFLEATAKDLNSRFASDDLNVSNLIEYCVNEKFADKVCLVSSFGADSAVLISLVLQVSNDVPIMFIDTNKHFEETTSYLEKLRESLDIKHLTIIAPRPQEVTALDPDGDLHKRDPDHCCHIRKTLPMVRGLNPFSAWLSGRKRFQTNDRSSLELFEVQDARIKINPLANWSSSDILYYAKELNLPPHPLIAKGFPSIGCAPCTAPVLNPSDDSRAGRWAGREKTECGIHFENGKVVRSSQSS